MNEKSRVIVCAAIKCKNGTIVTGVRHFDSIMRSQIGNVMNDEIEWDMQGFIDNKGVFLSRTEAWKIAKNAGQIKYRVGSDHIDGGTLFSENLY